MTKGQVNDEGYVNVAGELGLSGERGELPFNRSSLRSILTVVSNRLLHVPPAMGAAKF